MFKPFLLSAAMALTVTPQYALAQQKQPTAQELDALHGRPVYSSEGQQIGEVTQVRAADGEVVAVRAELSVARGLGGKVVDIPASKFKQRGGRVELTLTTVEAAKLPDMRP